MHVVPVFFGLLRERNELAFDTRVVEGDVQAAEGVHRLLDEGFNVRGFRNVGLNEGSFSARSLNKPDGFFSFCFAPARDNDFRALLREEDRGVAPNSSGAAGDEGHFVI